VAGPGEVFALWVKVRDELRRVLVLSVGRTEAAGDAVCRAIAEYTGADADGRNSSAVAGQELWRKINDPREVDPEDPEQNPPTAPARGTAQDDPYVPNADAGATAASAATPDYLAELTTKAEEVKRLAIAKKKDDSRAFGDWIDHQFRAYSDKVNTAYGEWAEAYEQWQKQRPRHGADGPPPPDKPLQLDRIPTSELKAAYDKEVDSSYEWIVPAFQEWAASDPDVFTEHIAAIRGVEDRLGDGEALRLATSAQINLASQWDGAHCTNLRNFLGTLLVVRGNQQAVARTLRELLEAEQALYRPAGAKQHAAAGRQCPRRDRGQRRGGQARDPDPSDHPECCGVDCRCRPGDTIRWRVALCRRGDPQRDRRGIRRRREPAADRKWEIAQRGHRGRRPGEDV